MIADLVAKESTVVGVDIDDNRWTATRRAILLLLLWGYGYSCTVAMGCTLAPPPTRRPNRSSCMTRF